MIMKPFKVTLVLIFIGVLIVKSQTAPAIQWKKTFGGSLDETAKSIQQTTDGGYIAVGDSNSNDGDVSGNHGNQDFWIVKLDGSGNIQWQKSLGGTLREIANSVQQTQDGGYILAGTSISLDGDVTGNLLETNFWIVKLNSTGNIQWQKTLGGNGQDRANAIQQTSDGGYIVVGETSSPDGDVTGYHSNIDYWIVKLDSLGNIQWQKALGGSLSDRGYSVQQVSDGGYIVAGDSTSSDGDVTVNHGAQDFWIVKLNSTGNILWQKSLGGTLNDSAKSIQQTSDGGYIVAGETNSTNGNVVGNHGTFDYWITKLDSNGNLQWQKTLGGSSYDFIGSIDQTFDNGYIIAGSSMSSNGDLTENHGIYDYWVVKINAAGTLQWQKSLGGSQNENANAIQQTSDGGYIVAGSATSNNDDVMGNHGGSDFWIVKFAPDQLSTSENSFTNQPKIYPNPIKDMLYITHLPKDNNVTITDTSGRLVFSQNYHQKNIRINLSEFNNGNYILQIKHQNTTILSEKIIINK